MGSSPKVSTRPYNLPPHGSRKRYRNVGCRCVGCTRGPHGKDVPTELMWPYRWLDKAAGTQIEAWYSSEQITTWKAEGLGDFEADEVCIKLGLMPFDVFPGYLDAGLDTGIYP